MVGTNFGFIGTAGAAETSYELSLSVQDGEFRKPTQSGRIECDFDFEENISRENTTLVSFDLTDNTGTSLIGDCAELAQNKYIIRYEKNCLKPDQTYYTDCILSADGPRGPGRGRRVVQFNTKSNLEVSASITPTTGNEFTDFTINIEVTHDYGVSCRLGYIDPDTYETVPFGKKINIGANGSATANKQKLLPLTYADGESLLYCIACDSKVTEDIDDPILDVTFTPYEGSDLVTLQEAQVDEFTANINSINFTDAGQAASSQAADAIGNLITASAGFASATDTATTEILDFFGEALENLDFDTDENLAELVVESIIAIGELIDENVNPDSALKMMDTFETILVGKQTARNLAGEPSFDDVLNTKTIPEENVKQQSKKTCKNMGQALSDLVGAATKTKNANAVKKEQMIRKLLITFDRLIKGCLNNQEEGTDDQNPGKEVFFVMKKVPKEVASLSTPIKYEFDCPCSSGYGYEAPASSYKSRNEESVNIGARITETSSSTTTSANK